MVSFFYILEEDETMTFYQLMYLSEAARCGSISAAAKNLHISQPTLSESIHELEKEYSIQIFTRSNKGISLTQDGNDFLQHAQHIIHGVEDMNDRFLQSSHLDSLNISTTKLPFVQKTFQDFCRDSISTSRPSTFSYIEKFSSGVISDILNGESDIGIILISEPSESVFRTYMDNFNIEYHYLLSSVPQIVLRKGHPLIGKTEITESDLDHYPIIYTYKASDPPLNNNQGFYSYNLKRFSNIIYTYNQSTVFDFLSTSDAFCIMSCTNGLAATHPGLCTLPYPYPIKWNGYWIRQSRHHLTPNESAFIEKLCENALLP